MRPPYSDSCDSALIVAPIICPMSKEEKFLQSRPQFLIERDDPTRPSLARPILKVDRRVDVTIGIGDHVPREIGDLPRLQSCSNRQKHDDTVLDLVEGLSDAVEKGVDLRLLKGLLLFSESHDFLQTTD